MSYKLLKKICRTLSHTVFPPKCLVCRSFFKPPEDGRPAALKAIGQNGAGRRLSLQAQVDLLLTPFLCPVCIRGLTGVASPLCTCCGLPFKSRLGEDHLCGECLTSPKKFAMARAVLVYEPILTEVIHCFKYKGKIQLANSLAELLLAAFRMFWQPDQIDMVIPVPLHLARLRKRGFNQSYLLIRNWNVLAGRYFASPPGFRIEPDILVRMVATAPQTAFGRSQRATNLKNAFDLRHRDAIKDKRILVVDDVYTTGSTVQECTDVLLDQGARRVDVLTLARAV
jgi:ComF family protein